MSFLDIYSLRFFVHNNFKKHCNSRTEISPINFQNTLQKIGKNIRNYTFLKWISYVDIRGKYEGRPRMHCTCFSSFLFELVVDKKDWDSFGSAFSIEKLRFKR